MNYDLKPNFKVAGPKLGKDIKAFGNALRELDPKKLIDEIEEGKEVEINIAGKDMKIPVEFIDIRINAKSGFAVAMENNVFTILDTNITPELACEGLARELISKVQQMRKEKDFEMMDRIKINVEADEEVKSAIAEYEDYIKSETLANEINFVSIDKKVNLNGHDTGLDVEKED